MSKFKFNKVLCILSFWYQVIIAKNGNSVTKVPPTDQKLRELKTLKAHYYPEGGWGWVILSVASCVHLLVIGSQVDMSALAL